MKRLLSIWLAAAFVLILAGCGNGKAMPSQTLASSVPKPPAEEKMQTGLIAQKVLKGADGEIHYSYYLPEDYDGIRNYPMVVVMPGYDMMWFGEESSGSNLNWSGFLSWTKLDTEMIVVCAQLTDWQGTLQAAKPCQGLCRSGRICMPLIFMAHPSGTEVIHRSQKMAWRSIFIWQRATNIMAAKRRGPLMKTFIMRIKAQAGARRILTGFCGWRYRIMTFLMNREFTIIMGVQMWYLMIRKI